MSFKARLERLPFYNEAVLPVHFSRALIAGARHGFPGKKLRVIGVTGTNGKTTTCFMIWKMLNTAGIKTGVMTTVGWGVDKINKQVEHMTTVGAESLNARIQKITEAGAEVLVLEVTSHAMVQFRTLGIPVEIAVMTNVTHEHLDYHKTFRRYRDAKRKLFKKAKYGVVNADDKSARWFLGDVPEGVSYGIRRGDLRAFDIELGAGGVKYACRDMKNGVKRVGGSKNCEKNSFGDIIVQARIPGEFNVYNSLAAVAVGRKMGLKDEQIAKGIFSLDEVEGRMNRVEEGQDFMVIVDYAHTPDAIAKVFESIKGEKGRKIAVHGGAGRRDETTRAERGEILGREADYLIVTEDDSRDEDPKKIAAQFVEGAKRGGMKAGENVVVILDRKKAIEAAIKKAKKGDIVLILGKGHEKTILRADGAHSFEDLKVTKEILRRKNNEN